jgi:hypothetical protein
MKITRFEDIEACKLGRDLRQDIYKAVKATNFLKDYSSKMSNIAEGFNAESNAEFIRFLCYALSCLVNKFQNRRFYKVSKNQERGTKN